LYIPRKQDGERTGHIMRLYFLDRKLGLNRELLGTSGVFSTAVINLKYALRFKELNSPLNAGDNIAYFSQ
jgi:hypothetical protein